MTVPEYELADVHSKLMAQNTRLRTLLDQSQDMATPTSGHALDEEVLESKITFEDYRT